MRKLSGENIDLAKLIQTVLQKNKKQSELERKITIEQRKKLKNGTKESDITTSSNSGNDSHKMREEFDKSDAFFKIKHQICHPL